MKLKKIVNLCRSFEIKSVKNFKGTKKSLNLLEVFKYLKFFKYGDSFQYNFYIFHFSKIIEHKKNQII